ncbi:MULTISPECIES: gamma-mobile-trio protein GmtX [unclassified Pseudomonas]|uniref:gamma-mobile-trio protein GmtX n=1 Tax=unclassified Pseudomonas TaxID=196821 RepID=UPI001B3270C0|nr:MULTISPECIES: gamma-mobile-trio protein GmtX [unclassified Pseudomonas]
MTPEEILAHLKEKAPRQQATLDAIFAVCQEQVERGVADFSFATIARLGAGRGVPKVQSIRNKTGENYRTLIKCFEGSQGARKRVPKSKAADSWVDEIEDPKLRLMANITLSKLAEAERLNRELIPPGMEIRIDDRSASGTEYKLSPVERRAIEHLMSDEFLNTWRLKVGNRGTVIDEQGKIVFKPGTLDALTKILKHL